MRHMPQARQWDSSWKPPTYTLVSPIVDSGVIILNKSLPAFPNLPPPPHHHTYLAGLLQNGNQWASGFSSPPNSNPLPLLTHLHTFSVPHSLLLPPEQGAGNVRPPQPPRLSFSLPSSSNHLGEQAHLPPTTHTPRHHPLLCLTLTLHCTHFLTHLHHGDDFTPYGSHHKTKGGSSSCRWESFFLPSLYILFSPTDCCIFVIVSP